MIQNFYEELNIPFNANEQSILNALQRKAQSGACSLEEIQTIKETLLNPEKRAEYNQILMQNKSKNFYEILNISPNASENIILNAIRRKAESGELSLEQIREIKETLLDTEKREKYNQTIVLENKSEITPQKSKKLKQEQRILIMSLAALLLIFLFGIGSYSYMDYKEKPKEVDIDKLYQKDFSHKPKRKDMVKIGSSKISKGELLFFTQSEKLLNEPNLKPLSPEKNRPIVTEYLATSKDNKGNLLVLYHQKLFNDKTTNGLGLYASTEKHIQWFNINLPESQNEKIKQASSQINRIWNSYKIKYHDYASNIKLLDNGKLIVMDKDQTNIFPPFSYVSTKDIFNDKKVTSITMKPEATKTIPIGEALFVNDRYLAFDTKNRYPYRKGEERKKLVTEICSYDDDECHYGDQWKYKASIVFYDMENEKLSDVRIHYDVQNYALPDKNFTAHGDTTFQALNKNIFIDKKGEKIGIHFRINHMPNNNSMSFKRESALEVYQINRQGDTIIGVTKILQQSFPETYLNLPQFSDDGKEIYFIQSPVKEETKNAEFVRWSVNKNKEIYSHKIDVSGVTAFYFNPKRNELFAVGKPVDNALTMFNKDKKPSDGYRFHKKYEQSYVYYHNLEQENGYIDHLMSTNTYLMRYVDFHDTECEFLFSENQDIFMPICRGFLKTPVYFHTTDMKKPVYLNDILKEKNIVY